MFENCDFISVKSTAAITGNGLRESWVGGPLSDSARAKILVDVPKDADVAVLSPGFRPAVLDLPEILSVIGSESDGEDTVVELSAGNIGKDTSCVMLPVLVGIDGDGNGLLGDGLGKNILAVRLDIRQGQALGSINLGARFLANAIVAVSRSVGVVVFSAQTVHSNVRKGIIHDSSVASLVEVHVAADELLLGESKLLAVLLEVSGLHGAGGGERPAATALALVLDVGDSIGGGPIDRVGGLHVGKGIHHASFPLRHLAEVHAGEFLKGKVGELVLAEGPGVVSGVVGADELTVSGVDGKALLVLRGTFKLDVVLFDVLDKVVLVLLEKGEVGGLGDAGGDGKEHGRFHGLSVSGERSGAKMR